MISRAHTAERTGADAGKESNRLRRLVLTGFLGLSLLAVAVIHMPWLPVGVQAAGHSLTNLIGQEVRWTMFSADPRGTSLDLRVNVQYTDGSTSIWIVPRSDVLGDFGFYRLVKWMETAVLDPKPGSLEDLAEWVVANAAKPVQQVQIWAGQRLGAHPSDPPHDYGYELVLEIRPGGPSG
jgi:hypothetical protein